MLLLFITYDIIVLHLKGNYKIMWIFDPSDVSLMPMKNSVLTGMLLIRLQYSGKDCWHSKGSNSQPLDIKC